MKYWLQKKAALLLLPLFLVAPVFASADEAIDAFVVSYVVNTDGTVSVTEQLRYDFDTESKRGIFRTLETDHPQPASTWFKNRRVAIDVATVTRDGGNEPYTVTNHGDEVEIRIGDPDVYITGIQNYEIVYTLQGALSYGTEGAEFYWNVTGNNWPVTVRNVEVIVSAAPGVLVPTLYACYVGPVGATEPCLRAESDGETVTRFGASNLYSGEGLTIGQAVNQSVVTKLVVESWSLAWLLALLLPLALLFVVVAVYRRQTAHKPNDPIIAQYEPYGDLLPMYTGVVFDGRLDPYDITAGIVYLAEQGFIKIKHIEKKVLGLFSSNDYELTLLRPVAEAANEPLQAILTWIFSTSSKSTTTSIFNGIKISFSLGSSVTTEPVEVGKTIVLSTLATRSIENAKTTLYLQKVLTERFTKEGYQETPLSFLGISRRVLVTTLLVVIVASALATVVLTSPLPVVFIGVAVVLLVVSFVPRRTRKGYEARFHLLGFKDFLSVTDSERFKFHNAPEKSPELFMKYLPYAIALKVEKEWAKAFEGITMPNPDWYEGGHLGAFSAATFTSDLSSFSSSFSASSGTSGSSGGGSSGGGGGGGGGGSW